MKRWIFAVFFMTTAASAFAKDGKWLDDSYEVFLSAKLKKAATSYRDFPLFWWNFMVIEKGATADAALQFGERLCQHLGGSEFTHIRKLPCHFNLTSPVLQPVLESWIADAPLRRDFPGAAEFAKQASATLAKASLPLPREMLEWLRRDPLDELGDLKRRLENKASGPFERKGAFMADAESGRVLMPFQFDFPPTMSAQTRELEQAVQNFCKSDVNCPGVHLFGPHAGSMENEFQIRDDIKIVSSVGTLCMAALIFFIVWSRRYRLLLLFPLMGVALIVAAAITVAVFGDIHAISLSFGPGLIGLAMDYGIHAAFLDPRSKHTWRANFMALLTSLVIMFLLGLSSIPLLRQMMFFSVVGLTLSYCVFYFFLTRFPDMFAVTPFRLKPKPWVPLEMLSLILLLGSAFILIQPLRLGLQHLNFETPKTEELRRWFFEKSGEGAPYTLTEAPGIMAWALSQGIRYEGPSTLLPPAAEQERHLATWQNQFCGNASWTTDSNTAKFFAPFIELNELVCRRVAAQDINSTPPAYLLDYTDGHQWTAVLFPANDKHVARIHERYPEATSPRELIARFPKTFAGELAWMVPIALGGAFLFLLLYYRSFGFALLACVPFVTGVGGFALMTFPLDLPVTFISLMGLLMVFGFSLDYGIFAVDYMLNPQQNRQGVWSALTICAVTTVAGFTPMAMGHHPVLHNLGHALLWGSLGTYVGTFWGVPAGYRLLFAAHSTQKVAA